MRDTDDDDWESKLDQTLDTIFLPQVLTDSKYIVNSYVNIMLTFYL